MDVRAIVARFLHAESSSTLSTRQACSTVLSEVIAYKVGRKVLDTVIIVYVVVYQSSSSLVCRILSFILSLLLRTGLLTITQRDIWQRWGPTGSTSRGPSTPAAAYATSKAVTVNRRINISSCWPPDSGCRPTARLLRVGCGFLEPRAAGGKKEGDTRSPGVQPTARSQHVQSPRQNEMSILWTATNCASQHSLFTRFCVRQDG